MTVIAVWSRAEVIEFLGDGTPSGQAEAMVRRGMVTDAQFSFEAGEVLFAISDGDRCSITVGFGFERGRLHPTDAACLRCGRTNCRHVAAALLSVADTDLEVDDWALPAGTLAAASDSAWRRELAGLLDPDRPSANRELLGLQFTLEHSFDGAAEQPHVAVRLVAPGKKAAWVRSSLDWDRLGYLYVSHHYDRDQVAAVQALAAIAPRGWRQGSSSVLRLDDAENPALWPILAGVQAAGVALVQGGRSGEPLVIGAPVTPVLDVTEHDGALRAEPRFVADGAPGGPVTGLIGTHGVFWAEPVDAPTRAMPSHRITIAPLVGPLPRAARDWFAAPRSVAIPPADRDEFVEQLTLGLGRRITVGSHDGSFVPPEVPAPTLQLLVEQPASAGGEIVDLSEFRRTKQRRRADGGDADQVESVTWRLSWRWRYGTGRAARTHPLAPDPMDGRRDLTAERAIAERVAQVARDFEPLWAGGADGPTRSLTAAVALTGSQCVQFQRDLLPQLRQVEGVTVTVRATELTEALDPALVTVSTDPQEGTTDWFDLSVTLSIDGQHVPFGPLFAALAKGEPYLVLTSGTYFALDRPELAALRALIEEARALSDQPGGMSISRYQTPLWDELTALGIVSRQAAEWQAAVARISGATLSHGTPLPPGFVGTLRDYQQEGYDWLAYLHRAGLGGVLADDMGLGKTVQCLAMMDLVLSGGARCDDGASLGAGGSTGDAPAAADAQRSVVSTAATRADSPTPPFLVVAPTSVVSNWAREAAQFVPGRRVAAITQTNAKRPVAEEWAGCDIVITSYALFRIDFEHYAAADWSGLVLDEAQMVKNRQSQAHRCARRLATPFKLAVTGTPMENNVMELWALLSITNPGLFPRPDRFREYFAKPIESGKHPELLATLRRRIRPFLLRRTKNQVALDLPPKQEQVLELPLAPAQRRVYSRHLQRERQKVLGLLHDLDSNRFQIFRSLTLLRRLALDCSLVDDDYTDVPSAKLDAAMEMITGLVAEGHRALVFSQFTSFLGLLRARLAAADVPVAYLDGSTRDRERVISRFRDGGAPVFLVSLKAGGFGLNLTEADYCLMLDPWWNPATEAQAIDRAHRIGQTKNVMVYRLVAKDTIEEKVMAMKARKSALFDAVIGTENADPTGLTADDIRELLA